IAGFSLASPTAVEPTATAPDAERRQLTVMFCDLQGSTALSQQLDPEELRDVIRSYQEVCAGAVGRFEGHIAKYLGDGLLVYFGYPQAHEDDPQRAVRAGLAILEDMGGLNAQLKSERDLELTVRIGIHTGLVVAGEMGGGDTIEELAIVGETPNIAARIEGAALPNSVVVSNITANLIQGFFLHEALGPHELKGISEPVELFRVLEESGAQTRFEVAAAAQLTPLVGREQELGLLLDRWEQVEEGLGQVVLISGEAGIGKSRLLQAINDRLAGQPHYRQKYRCSPYHQNSALYPVIDFLERWMRFRREDTSEERLLKLERGLEDYLVPTTEAVPLLAGMLSVPLDDRYPALNLSPQLQRQKTLGLLVQLMMETASKQPVLAVFEDLHWADPTTMEFLGLLLDQVPTVKVLAMFTFRPEFTPPWGSWGHLTQITLNRLPRRLATDMIARLPGGKEFPEEVVTQIATKSDGVPLFVEELTRMVVESGLLHEVDGRYELSGPLPPLAIPSTLQDSLTARLDRLSSVRESVQLAAVLGREFSYELIRAVSPVDEPTLLSHLDQLGQAEFLYQRGMPPEATYIFKHALIQDAAYESLLKSRRQQYHQQVAQVLEQRFSETVENQPELLAYHYTEAGIHEQAVVYWRRAGQGAFQSSAYREAVAFFEQALGALKHLPETRNNIQLAIDLRVDLRNQFFPLGELGRVIEYLREAEILAKTVDDQRRLGLVSSHMSHYFWLVGEPDSALESVDRALAIAETLQDPGLHALACRRLGQVNHALGNYPRAEEFLRTAALEFDRSREQVSQVGVGSVISRIYLVYCLGERGEFTDGVAGGEEAIRIAQSADDPLSVIGAYDSLGALYLGQGDFPQAISLLERGLELGKATGIPRWIPAVAAHLGAAYALSGRVREALPLLQLAEERGAIEVTGHALRVANLGECHLLAGRTEDASKVAQRALALSRDHKERGNEAWALRLLGEVAAHQDPPEVKTAYNHYRQAMALAEELGMRPLVAHCHLDLGKLCRHMGRQQKAKEHLTTAATMFREMDMRFWLEKAEEETRRLA
ncbi:MAG: AAA family ATPase, partial [Chloroflexi bacterium]|nr:AAA family ATPase [Chloroflexota bacterium]